MNALKQHHLTLGARLAPDLIPLEYGDQAAELAAAIESAILLDRSHEGRILLCGRDRLALVNRMSTNDVATLSLGQGAPTVFTNANARILFRALCCEQADGLLLVSEAGRGAALAAYLGRNIFFGDEATLRDATAETAQFALHGPRADFIAAALDKRLTTLPRYSGARLELDLGAVTIVRRKPMVGSHWALICRKDAAAKLHRHLLEVGAPFGLTAAGSLTYNSLRIAGGCPAAAELSTDYLPLEVGLWDEISFTKGCYTGQEIIARMESRARLAKVLVKIALSAYVPAPAPIWADGRQVGTLTSSVAAADDKLYALGVVKLEYAGPRQRLSVGSQEIDARVLCYAGAAPPFISREDD